MQFSGTQGYYHSYQRVRRHCITALLLIVSSTSFAEEATRDVWAFGLQTPSIIRNKLQPFFDAVGAKSGIHYRVISSTDETKVLSRCMEGEPAIVAASKPMADKVEQRCGYKKVLVSRQIAILYSDGNSELDWVNRPSIGFIAKVDITKIAEQELHSRNLDYQPYYYRDYFDLIRFYKRDKLDAVVLTELGMQSVASFKRGKKPIHVFSQPGEAFVLVAPIVTDVEIENLIAAFVTLSTQGDDNWVRGVGLTGFEPIPRADDGKPTSGMQSVAP